MVLTDLEIDCIVDLSQDLNFMSMVLPEPPQDEVHAVGGGALRQKCYSFSKSCVIVSAPEEMPLTTENCFQKMLSLNLLGDPTMVFRDAGISTKLGLLEISHELGRHLKVPCHCERSSVVIGAVATSLGHIAVGKFPIELFFS